MNPIGRQAEYQGLDGPGMEGVYAMMGSSKQGLEGAVRHFQMQAGNPNQSAQGISGRKEEKPAKPRKPYTITKQRERWTDEEHTRFLEALKLYGRTWRKIEEYIGTKTTVQIRSHAQKFFSKLEKDSPGASKADGAGIPEDVNIPPARAKRKTASPYPKNALSRASLDSMLASQGDVLALGQHGDSGELTVAAVAAAASKAAAAAAAAVVAAAGERVQAQFNAVPPQGFPFFGLPPALLASLHGAPQINLHPAYPQGSQPRPSQERTATSEPGPSTMPINSRSSDGDSACSGEDWDGAQEGNQYPEGTPFDGMSNAGMCPSGKALRWQDRPRSAPQVPLGGGLGYWQLPPAGWPAGQAALHRGYYGVPVHPNALPYVGPPTCLRPPPGLVLDGMMQSPPEAMQMNRSPLIFREPNQSDKVKAEGGNGSGFDGSGLDDEGGKQSGSDSGNAEKGCQEVSGMREKSTSPCDGENGSGSGSGSDGTQVNGRQPVYSAFNNACETVAGERSGSVPAGNGSSGDGSNGNGNGSSGEDDNFGADCPAGTTLGTRSPTAVAAAAAEDAADDVALPANGSSKPPSAPADLAPADAAARLHPAASASVPSAFAAAAGRPAYRHSHGGGHRHGHGGGYAAGAHARAHLHPAVHGGSAHAGAGHVVSHHHGGHRHHLHNPHGAGHRHHRAHLPHATAIKAESDVDGAAAAAAAAGERQMSKSSSTCMLASRAASCNDVTMLARKCKSAAGQGANSGPVAPAARRAVSQQLPGGPPECSAQGSMQAAESMGGVFREPPAGQLPEFGPAHQLGAMQAQAYSAAAMQGAGVHPYFLNPAYNPHLAQLQQQALMQWSTVATPFEMQNAFGSLFGNFTAFATGPCMPAPRPAQAPIPRAQPSGAEVQETVADFIKPSSPQPLAVQAELANLSMKSLSMGNLQGATLVPALERPVTSGFVPYAKAKETEALPLRQAVTKRSSLGSMESVPPKKRPHVML